MDLKELATKKEQEIIQILSDKIIAEEVLPNVLYSDVVENNKLSEDEKQKLINIILIFI